MKIVLIVDSGCEEACIQEIRELTGIEGEKSNEIITLDATSEQVAIITYHAQVPIHILAELSRGSDPESLGEPDMELVNGLVPEDKTFRASSYGAKEYHSQEIMEGLGGWFHLQCKRKVNLSRPDFTLIAIETPDGIIAGVDLVGKELTKRDWRIMLSRKSLRATIAAAAAVYSGISRKDVVLDPMSDDGTLSIELAMRLSGASPRRYEKTMAIEKMPLFERDWNSWKRERDSMIKENLAISSFSHSHGDMKAVKQNAKLAGVEKLIKITRVPVDWMDLKVEEGDLTAILTYPPVSGRAISTKQSEKMNDDLFNQAKYVLGKGTCTIVTIKPEENIPSAEKYGFTVEEKRKLSMGKQNIYVVKMRC